MIGSVFVLLKRVVSVTLLPPGAGGDPASRVPESCGPTSRDPASRVPEGAPPPRSRQRGAARPDVRPRALPELALVAVLFLAYKLGRLLVEGDVSVAFDNALTIWHLQRGLHLPSELAVQQALLSHEAVLRAANCYYAYVHFPATGAYLLWMYLRRPTHYRWARRGIASLTATALVVHILLPLAPPRMLTVTGMLDTGRLFGPAVYGDATTDTFTNQYAAMPSLHVGWALAVAIGLIAASRGRWRWAWLLHPLITLAVVVATGNHYWIDAVVAAVLLTIVLLIQPWPRARDRTAPAAPVRPPATDTATKVPV